MKKKNLKGLKIIISMDFIVVRGPLWWNGDPYLFKSNERWRTREIFIFAFLHLLLPKGKNHG